MRTTILVVPIFALAAVILYAATAYEQYDPYTRRYTVTFDYVRGLKKGNQVWARGFEVGRVEEVNLVTDDDLLQAAKDNPGEEKERVEVVLKTVPQLMLPKGSTNVSVEPLNPFGAMYVEIATSAPGPEVKVYAPEEAIKGEESETSPFVDALRRRDPAITEGLEQLRRDFEEFKNSDSFLSRALYQPGPAFDLDEAFTNYEEALADLARNLAALEEGEGGLGAALASDPEIAEELENTLEELGQSFGELSEALGQANRGEGQVGRWLKDRDGGGDTRELASGLAETGERLNGSDGLGATLADADTYRSLRDGSADLAEGTGSLTGEEGFGALFNDPAAGADVQSAIRSLDDALREAASDEGLIGDADSAEALRDSVGQLKELTSDLDEAIRRSVAGQPVNTIHGAVFSIF